MNQQIMELSSNMADISAGVDQVNSQMQETSSQLTGGYDASSTDISDIPQATGLDWKQFNMDKRLAIPWLNS